MAGNDAREKLIGFLDRKAFDPVLNASPDDYSEDKRDMLKEVQDATRRERERFHERDSARGVVDEFKGDMSSEPAEKIQRKLHALDLPTLPDLEKDFDRLAKDAGIE